ncbi:HlyD family efflux transporter periplasmic adaptor subunit [Rhodophyticola sp. CCM32]|uniref:efflux RND transporter periplasmic adaptor subunit n=1 Tax=Rhodophyticola sp. CCM32 TaxID=2916397 RepID=UPI00107F90B9|nr:HlyD family efflux transporter periplasmic adaptor subunit [Rhodophyticola sp. CCM32]QBY01711.1 HlyD family efflux transporter periplasmic adaptor subunit [Rhodophyticola sp. CCM32]
MRFFRRSVVGLFLISLTIGLLTLAGNTVYSALQTRWADEGRPGTARERVFTAEVRTVLPETVSPVLTAFGEVRSRRTLELRAPAEGLVIELSEGFEDGGAVEAGQLLLRIDPAEAQSARDTAAADLREAEAELRDASRALALAVEDVLAARTQADLRARSLTRQQDLADRGVGSAAAVETAELAAATADQAVLSRRQALAQAEAREDQAGSAIDRRQIALAEAERVLGQTELTAGFSGVLAEVNVVAGRLVNRNEQIARLIDPDALEVAFRVSTTQYSRLLDEDGTLPGLPVTVVLDVFGLDVTAPAVLTRESGAVEEGQSGRLLFAQLQGVRGFRTGDFVTVRLEETPLDDVALLPATAVDADNRVLVLGAEDRLEEAGVSLLRRQGDNIIIRAPPLYGREVVLARTPVLGAGIRINPLRPADGDMPEIAADTVALDPDRRARLIAFVEGNAFIPADVKDRMLRQLNQDEVPARMVARIEARMGS